MGSVIEYEKCEKCGGLTYVDYLYKSGEEYRFCMSCGKVYNKELILDEKQKPIFDKDGNVQYKVTTLPGYGCIKFLSKEGGGTYYPLEKPYEGSILMEYQKVVSSSAVDRDGCFLTRWDETQKKLIAVEGSVPESYDKQVENQMNDSQEK